MPTPSPAVVLTAATFTWPDGTVVLAAATAAFGRGRTGLVGSNGAGKSTLLGLIAGRNGAGKTTLLRGVLPEARVRVGYLPQRIDLPGDRTADDVIRAACPGVPPGLLKNRLARLLLRGPMLQRPIGSLSGGERFRVALGRLVLADPPPACDAAGPRRRRALGVGGCWALGAGRRVSGVGRVLGAGRRGRWSETTTGGRCRSAMPPWGDAHP